MIDYNTRIASASSFALGKHYDLVMRVISDHSRIPTRTITTNMIAVRNMHLGNHISHEWQGGLPAILELRIIDNMAITSAPKKISTKMTLGRTTVDPRLTKSSGMIADDLYRTALYSKMNPSTYHMGNLAKKSSNLLSL